MPLVETFYADHQASAAIQVSPARDYQQLDRHLADRGYRFTAPIQVLTAHRDALTSAARGDARWDVTFSQTPTAAWLAAFAESDGHDDSVAVAHQVIGQIALPTGFASVIADEQIVGVGLVVGGDPEWAGIYCMATHPEHRRRGMGRAVLRAGAQWAVDHGASGVYLQVARANTAAQRLYAAAGFSHGYDYHYRVAVPGARSGR